LRVGAVARDIRHSVRMPEEAAPWTWRQRLRDPRYPAFFAVGFSGSLLGAAIFGFAWPPTVLAIAVMAALGLRVLPRWRDTKHGPRAGAVVLYVGAASVVLLALVIFVLTAGCALVPLPGTY